MYLRHYLDGGLLGNLTLMKYHLQRLKIYFDRAWFDYRCNGIYRTAPVTCDPLSQIVVVSQLYHPDMAMYLLAVKSFSRYLRPRGFVIVDDGLTAEDKTQLIQHLGSVRIILRTDVMVGKCPRHGCWERLLTLSDENHDSYVIQLDSDTLTLSMPSEVRECIAQGKSFTLGTSSGRHFVSLADASSYARKNTSTHVQACAERVLDQLPDAEVRHYVRGCAGFTGFAQGELPRHAIEKFSTEMQTLLGDAKWHSWGSEQVASNYMVANAPASVVLPVERYPFYGPEINIQATALVHFFGTFRYRDGAYLRAALSIMRELQ